MEIFLHLIFCFWWKRFFFTNTEKPLKFQKFAKPRKIVKTRKEAEESSALPLVKQASTHVKKEEDPMQKYEALPVFARPYRSLKDGRWVVRPNKAPKSMMDIFLDVQNFEFFKRYMQFTGKDMPLLLWEAVEQLKYIKEAKARHQHVAFTFKKFFLNKNSESLFLFSVIGTRRCEI